MEKHWKIKKQNPLGFELVFFILGPVFQVFPFLFVCCRLGDREGKRKNRKTRENHKNWKKNKHMNTMGSWALFFFSSLSVFFVFASRPAGDQEMSPINEARGKNVKKNGRKGGSLKNEKTDKNTSTMGNWTIFCFFPFFPIFSVFVRFVPAGRRGKTVKTENDKNGKKGKLENP